MPQAEFYWDPNITDCRQQGWTCQFSSEACSPWGPWCPTPTACSRQGCGPCPARTVPRLASLFTLPAAWLPDRLSALQCAPCPDPGRRCHHPAVTQRGLPGGILPHVSLQRICWGGIVVPPAGSALKWTHVPLACLSPGGHPRPPAPQLTLPPTFAGGCGTLRARSTTSSTCRTAPCAWPTW